MPVDINTHANELKIEGLSHIASRRTVMKDGIQYEEITFTDRETPLGSEPEWGGWAMGCAKRIGAGILSPGGLISNEWKRKTWDTALNGRAEEKTLSNRTDPLQAERVARPGDPQGRTELVARLGYDPKNRASIKAYLELPKNRKRLCESNGHFYLREKLRKGTSSFLFVPNGDFDKASSIVVSKADSGEALSGAEFIKTAQTYCAQYEDMQKGISEKAEKFATAFCKKHGIEDDDPRKEAKKEEFLKLMRNGVAVLHPRGKYTSIFAKVDPNKRSVLNSLMGGTKISWGDSTGKESAHIWEKEPGTKLTEDKPFEHEPPPPDPAPAAA